jgi:hypothetical protein
MQNRTDILNELKALSPTLFAIKENEKQPEIPANYFNDFAENILLTAKEEEGFLGKLKKDKIEVPVNYFNDFADNIIDKIKTEQQTISEGKVIVLQPQKNKTIKLFSKIAIAASVVGVLVFGIKNYNETTVNNCEDGIACLTQDEIYNYMNENIEQFDLQQVQDAVAPVIENAEIKIEKHEAEKYIEQNKSDVSFEDASTDIF